MKFSLIFLSALLGLLSPILAVELTSSVSKSAQHSEDRLTNWIQEFETKSLLEAKKNLEQLPESTNRESLQGAFKIAIEKDNTLAMVILANQLHVLDGHGDLIAEVTTLHAEASVVQGKLTQMLQDTIVSSVKSPQWSHESVKLTNDAIQDRLHNVQLLVKELLTPNLKRATKAGKSRLINSKTFAHSLAADSRQGND